MKIILSRKGFDTNSGGFASPIFPNKTCYSVPIPSKLNKKRYSELDFIYENEPIQQILNDITHNRIKINGKIKKCNYFDNKFTCHLDPQLIQESRSTYLTFG